MLDSIRKTKIGKNEYQIHLLPARKGMEHAMKLAQVIIPALGGSFDAQDEFKDYGFTQLSLVVVEQMNQIDIMDLVDEMFQGASINGQELDIDKHFRANYGDLIELITFAMKENFGSFFKVRGLTAHLSRLKEQMFPKESTPEESSE